MADSIFWIWMQEALGAGNIKADKAVELLDSPEALYNLSGQELARTGLFAPKEVEKIKATTLEHANENLRMARHYGCQVVTPDSPDYPAALRHIDCRPSVLYALGDLSGLENELILTMVGTRTSTEYGENCALSLSRDLAAAGCVIASGLAVGIDYACHEGALACGGRTLGLLACGMNVGYPQASKALKRRILDGGGALITEFPFGEPAYRPHFYIRNRILSGIASGVVVVQAPEQSGALITARHALEQNREVFAVPGELFDLSMRGCNRLIGEGAKIVLDVSSILEEYLHKFPDKLKSKTAPAPLFDEASGRIPHKLSHPAAQAPLAPEPEKPLAKLDEAALAAMHLSEAAKAVYGALEEQPADCGLLLERTKLSASQVMSALTELELHDLAAALPGGRYVAGEGPQ